MGFIYIVWHKNVYNTLTEIKVWLQSSTFVFFQTLNFVLGYSWLTTFWWFEVNSEGTQSSICRYPFSHKLPSHPGWHITFSRGPGLCSMCVFIPTPPVSLDMSFIGSVSGITLLPSFKSDQGFPWVALAPSLPALPPPQLLTEFYAFACSIILLC